MSKKGLGFFKFLFLGFALVIIGFYFFPIIYFQKLESAKLYMRGVEFTQTAHFDYFKKNNCIKDQPCQCVLLIHGLGDFAYTWSQTLSSPNFPHTQFFAVNLPGSLNSPKLSLDKNESYELTFIAELLKKEILPECSDWVSVGNSYGGWITLRLAQNDARVKKIMLLAPAGLNKKYDHILDYFINPSIPVAREFYQKSYFKPFSVPEFIFKAVVSKTKSQPVPDMLKAIDESDFVQSSIKLDRPVKILWGSHDQVMPAEWAKEYQSFIVDSQLKIINECGHLPQKECFTDFEKELESFLKL